MKTSRILSLLAVVFVAATVSVQAQLETLGIGEVKATPALLRALENNGKSTSLERLSQALESQLTDRFHATRKFKIVSRADLQSVLKERDLNSSSGDAATVEQFKLAATKYVLITTIDDYEDLNETATFAGAGNSATRRLIRLSCVGKLYETSSGKLVESAPFQTTNSNVAEVRLTLRHEVVDGAYYHYAHGLKKHTGHCQRIAHGHRSRIEIRLDGRREPALEQAWAGHWKDIYLGTQEDIVVDGAERVRFEYTSVDGDFALELPAQRCELLDGDTTVEKLARYIAQAVHAEHPGRQVEVRAYEGVLKGAVARAG